MLKKKQNVKASETVDSAMEKYRCAGNGSKVKQAFDNFVRAVIEMKKQTKSTEDVLACMKEECEKLKIENIVLQGKIVGVEAEKSAADQKVQ